MSVIKFIHSLLPEICGNEPRTIIWLIQIIFSRPVATRCLESVVREVCGDEKIHRYQFRKEINHITSIIAIAHIESFN